MSGTMHDEDETEDLLPATTDDPIEKPAITNLPVFDGQLHVTPTYYELLAEEMLQDIDKLAAKIPKLELHHRVSQNAIRAHSNIPRPFLGTAVVVTEDTPEIETAVTLVPSDARETLQYLDAMRVVDDRLDALRNNLRFNMMSRRAALALQALQVYALARSLARDPRNTKIAMHVENLKRDLGKRGRPRKKKGEEAV